MREPSDVPGWETVVDWFGYSPTFHDAEVVSIDLRRDPESSFVRVHAWRTNEDTTEEGYFRQDRHVIVTFSIKWITSLSLDDWNHQNVLSELWVDRTESGYVLHLPGSWGLDGEIGAVEISVSIEPADQRSACSRAKRSTSCGLDAIS